LGAEKDVVDADGHVHVGRQRRPRLRRLVAGQKPRVHGHPRALLSGHVERFHADAVEVDVLRDVAELDRQTQVVQRALAPDIAVQYIRRARGAARDQLPVAEAQIATRVAANQRERPRRRLQGELHEPLVNEHQATVNARSVSGEHVARLLVEDRHAGGGK
jgi:hypothetical protein